MRNTLAGAQGRTRATQRWGGGLGVITILIHKEEWLRYIELQEKNRQRCFITKLKMREREKERKREREKERESIG